jgi:hypothetical protein
MGFQTIERQNIEVGVGGDIRIDLTLQLGQQRQYCYRHRVASGSAIVPPAQGTYGTMLPGALRGPGEGLVNFAASKDMKFNERFRAQFGFEAFNLFNRTQYAGQDTGWMLFRKRGLG